MNCKCIAVTSIDWRMRNATIPSFANPIGLHCSNKPALMFLQSVAQTFTKCICAQWAVRASRWNVTASWRCDHTHYAAHHLRIERPHRHKDCLLVLFVARVRDVLRCGGPMSQLRSNYLRCAATWACESQVDGKLRQPPRLCFRHAQATFHAAATSHALHGTVEFSTNDRTESLQWNKETA